MTPDNYSAGSERISEALDEIEETGPHQTDGKWLERLTADCAPLIADWNVDESWMWADWPDREPLGYDETPLGIDVVARRVGDGGLIAIQCKSRKLDEAGKGSPVGSDEINSFLVASEHERWAERWLVVNGNVEMGRNVRKNMGRDASKPVKEINIESDLRKQADVLDSSDDSDVRRSRDRMQDEAIGTSVRLLREHAQANEDSRARGRIILPCGTGKSRIALRIVEELTAPGQVSAVLCPSIALVAQLRGEFLAHCRESLNALAVCSDEGVAKQGDLASDPTADLGHASASEVKGLVTTRADEIARWMDDVAAAGDRRGVIFGTYQSSHRIADALDGDGRQVQVMIADEAHRTAGLRRIPRLADRLRDFTVCHEDARFPAKYRVYQTATPRVYTGSGATRVRRKTEDWIVRDMADESVFGPELYRRSYAEAVANGWLTDYRIIAIGVNDEDAYETAAARGRHGQSETGGGRNAGAGRCGKVEGGGSEDGQRRGRNQNRPAEAGRGAQGEGGGAHQGTFRPSRGRRPQRQPPREVRACPQPRRTRRQHPRGQHRGSEAVPEGRRTGRAAGSPFWAGPAGRRQAKGAGGRLHNCRAAPDERRHAAPANRRRGLAARDLGTGHDQERAGRDHGGSRPVGDHHPP